MIQLPRVNGTITGSNYAWVPGVPFDLNLTPDTPTLVSPADTATNVPVSTSLTVHVSDARNSNLTVSFYGREKGTTEGRFHTHRHSGSAVLRLNLSLHLQRPDELGGRKQDHQQYQVCDVAGRQRG